MANQPFIFNAAMGGEPVTIEKIDAPSANITLPLNQSVQQANGAQFALMLSLMMESVPARTANAAGTAPVVPVASAPSTISQAPQDFNLETSQSRALQQQQMSHFHLLHSLYEERVMPVDVELQLAKANAGLADDVLQEIGQGQSTAPVMGREAEKVSLAA